MEPKFILDREKISDEEIEKHKNFDELVKQFKNESIQKARNDRSWWKQKRIRYSAIIAGAAVVCTVTLSQLYNTSKTEKINDSNSTLASDKKEITSPVAQQPSRCINPINTKLDVPYTRYKVNADKGAELKHPSKSQIKVPKAAFVNKTGQEITGEVEILYREFHKVIESVVAGIPMRYDSAGKSYDFESAGMFDIQGIQNGEPVFLKANTTLTVQLASEKTGTDFNQYYLDTLNRKWNYLQEDVITPLANKKIKTAHSEEKRTAVTEKTIETEVEKTKIEGLAKIERGTSQKIAAIPTIKVPAKPRKKSNRPTFTLEIDKNEFPELSGFSNVVFEVGEENKNYSDKYTEVTWNDVLVKDGPRKGENYLLQLRKGQTLLELIVYPCLTGADFEKANAAFKTKMQEYEKALTDRKAKEEMLKAEMLARQKEYAEEMKRNKEERLREFISQQKQMEAQFANQIAEMKGVAKVMRVFQVSNFGVYNSDCPREREDGFKPNVRYAINNQIVQPGQVLAIDYTSKMLNTYNGAEVGQLNLRKETRYILCVALKGKVYVHQLSDASNLVSDNKQLFTVQLTELPSDVSTLDEVKRFFEI
jgi:hypothetical protein